MITMAEEFTAPATESEFEEITAPPVESEVPQSGYTVPSVEDEIDRPDDLSVYIQGDGTYLGPEIKKEATDVTTLGDMKSVYNSLDSCKTVDEIAASTGLPRATVVECVQELINTYHLISQDDDRFCNIAAVSKLQSQFDKICVACSRK